LEEALNLSSDRILNEWMNDDDDDDDNNNIWHIDSCKLNSRIKHKTLNPFNTKQLY
jgi:hypothetical protein